MFDVLLNITYLAAIAMSLYSAVWLLLKADAAPLTRYLIPTMLRR